MCEFVVGKSTRLGANSHARGCHTPYSLSKCTYFCIRGKSTLFSFSDLEIGLGEWITITGANGSGKTTLLVIHSPKPISKSENENNVDLPRIIRPFLNCNKCEFIIADECPEIILQKYVHLLSEYGVWHPRAWEFAPSRVENDAVDMIPDVFNFMFNDYNSLIFPKFN
jgi:hypothetical protein